MKTYSAKPGEVTRRWFIVDAEGQVLGRLATRVASVLRGKHKPQFTPHLDTGDFVIVINAEKVKLTGAKLDQKQYRRHSGYPGGLRELWYGKLLEKHPERAVERAVWGMLPKTSLGRRQLRKLKVYRGSDHPHEAQKPHTLELQGPIPAAVPEVPDPASVAAPQPQPETSSPAAEPAPEGAPPIEDVAAPQPQPDEAAGQETAPADDTDDGTTDDASKE